MKRGVILAIDQGTTNSKAMLVDSAGSIVATGSARVPLSFPRPGWAETDALALWDSVLAACSACIGQAEEAEIVAIGVANQRESVLMWDRRTGEPLGPCISWQCRRTADACDALRAAGNERWLRERTGLGIDPLFSASKAHWALDRVEDGLARASRGELCIGTVDAWIAWKLTHGEAFVTDVTNASRTQLMDLRRLAWADDAAELFGIPLAALPEIRASSAVVGTTSGAAPVPDGVPLAALAGDSHAALFGHGALPPGWIKATYGTGTSVMTAVPDTLLVEGLSSTVAWGIERPGQGIDVVYALEGNITVTGAALEWLATVLALPGGVADLEELAASVHDTGGVMLVPAFAGLGAPHWDADARGLIAGITRGTTAAHLARAAFDAVAFQVRDVVDVLRGAPTAAPSVLIADGGASRSDLLAHTQADLLGIPVRRAAAANASGLGAAYLAGLAIGWWNSVDEIRELPRSFDQFDPSAGAEAAEPAYRGWQAAVRRAIGRLAADSAPRVAV
jgi:glycerol kinase